MGIKIDALDTLFFRDGKPFTMGAETWANGMFPPSPSVIYGVLRSVYFSNRISDLYKANTTDDPTFGMRIKQICLQIGGSEYFPLPLDCAKKKGNKENTIVMLNAGELITSASCPVQNILKPAGNNKVETAEDGCLDVRSLNEYLKKPYDGLPFIKLSEYVLTEPKIGIGREALTRTAKEGMLYRVGMRRLESEMKSGGHTEKCYVVVDFENLQIPDKGITKLGGEGRAAAYEHIETAKIDAPQLNGAAFKLYLSTPAIFSKGWLPEWIDNNTFEGTFNGIRLKLVTTAIGRPVYIGGFDIKRKEPKPMRRAVPAGSVYYFEVLENKGNISITDAFHGKPISDDENDKKQGFGITFVGDTA